MTLNMNNDNTKTQSMLTMTQVDRYNGGVKRFDTIVTYDGEKFVVDLDMDNTPKDCNWSVFGGYIKDSEVALVLRPDTTSLSWRELLDSDGVSSSKPKTYKVELELSEEDYNAAQLALDSLSFDDIDDGYYVSDRVNWVSLLERIAREAKEG